MLSESSFINFKSIRFKEHFSMVSIFEEQQAASLQDLEVSFMQMLSAKLNACVSSEKKNRYKICANLRWIYLIAPLDECNKFRYLFINTRFKCAND